MKKLLVALFVLMNGDTVCAQDWRVGAKAGLSVPKLRAGKNDGGISSGYKSLMSPQFGLLAEYRFNDLISLQTELNYSGQGGKKSGKQKINTSILASVLPASVLVTLPQFLYANFDSEVDLTYLELPLMLRFSFQTNDVSRFSFYGGPYLGYLLKANGKSSGKSRVYTDPEQTNELILNLGGTPVAVGIQDLTMKRGIIDECNRINYGLQGAAAYTYTFSRWEFFIAAGGTYGMKFLQKNSDFGQNKTGGASVNIGATIGL